MRKGTKVRYTGTNELMQGKIYEVLQKQGSLITLYAPLRYLDGSIHNSKCAMNIKDFEVVK